MYLEFEITIMCIHYFGWVETYETWISYTKILITFTFGTHTCESYYLNQKNICVILCYII